MRQLTDFSAVMASPVGLLGILTTDALVVGIQFLLNQGSIIKARAPLALEVVNQLRAYFDHKLLHFSLPMKLSGTEFQASVLHFLNQIPYGSLITYQEIANNLKTSPRAVGNACRRNPLPIITPCHRVIAKNKIGGFYGQRLGDYVAIKASLIDFERKGTCHAFN